MVTYQYGLPMEERVRDAAGEVPLQTVANSARSCDVKAHEIIDAISAMVIGAHAGLNWLRAQPPNPEEARQALNNIAKDGKRACELLLRLCAANERAQRPSSERAMT